MRTTLKNRTEGPEAFAGEATRATLTEAAMWFAERVWLAQLAAVAILPGLALSCSEKASAVSQTGTLIGSACVPPDETLPAFSGSGSGGIEMHLDAADCGGEICVAYQFQGRVTCPYGQTAGDIAALSPTDPARCRLPDAAGKMTQQPVTVEVLPQLVEWQADKSVYCTCACSGTDSSREYCTCPSNMQCEQLLPTGDSRFTTTGVCVRLNSAADSRAASAVECSRNSSDPSTDCGNNRRNP